MEQKQRDSRQRDSEQDPRELRQEYRLTTLETVFIEYAEGQVIISNSLDMSANGLRIQIDRPLPVGSIHQTSIQLHDHGNSGERLQLVTEVKWVKPVDDEYLIGLSLFESEGTDIQHWKEMIAERCALSTESPKETDSAQ